MLHYKKIITVSLLALPALLIGQRDTTKKQSIDITSSYKPVLRNAVKINFSAMQLQQDTNRPILTYSVPAQNLFYAYQPITLRPLALQPDNGLELGDKGFVKIGYGNFSTPYAKAAYSMGDGIASMVNFYADYTSSKGKIKYQDFSMLHFAGDGTFFSPGIEAHGKVSFDLNRVNQFGYDQILYNNPKDSVQQSFQRIGFELGLKNTTLGEFGLSYAPNLQFTTFANGTQASETNIKLQVPLKKDLTENFAISLAGTADITNYKTKSLLSNVIVKNNVVQLAPTVSLKYNLFTLHAGVVPTWDNGTFYALPNVYGEGNVGNKNLILQAGWVGRYVKNNYENLVAVNPFIGLLRQQNNTKEVEFYGGLKAALGNHFNFAAKVSWVDYKNLPLFMNDTATDERRFLVLSEGKASNFRIHGSMSYVKTDDLSLTAGITLNGYTGFSNNAQPWHLPAMELTGSARYRIIRQLLLKADVKSFGGSSYIEKGRIVKNTGAAFDLSAGAEFSVTSKINLWLDVNNIFNQKYQRWNNYNVYGLQVLGGLKFNF